MNTVNPYLKQYKKNQVETANPEKLLILLYDAAIQFLNKALKSLEENDRSAFHHNLVSCEKIIIEFMNSLDMEKGGELAERLYELYKYYYNLLVNAGISKDTEKINEVLRHLTKLRDTWQKAIEIANAEKSSKLIEHVEEYSFEDYEENFEEEEDDDDDDGE